jgi:hypothetical protein
MVQNCLILHGCCSGTCGAYRGKTRDAAIRTNGFPLRKGLSIWLCAFNTPKPDTLTGKWKPPPLTRAPRRF